MKKIGIVGGTGYTGVELLRILANHPNVTVSMVTSRSHAGIRIDQLFPSLRGHIDLEFTQPDSQAMTQCDLVFFATPNGIAMKEAKALIDQGIKVIDLSADFRIKDIKTWESWYNMPHEAPQLVQSAVYGLPEINREAIKQAQLIANPGCYPTAVILGLLPLIENNLADLNTIIADTKSGVTGAGRTANVATLLAEAGDNFKAYAAQGHRHLPEINQILSGIANTPTEITFIPHLLPLIRGIHATLYTQVNDQQDLQSLYEDYYKNKPFVDILPTNSHPETRSVRSSNICRIAIHRTNKTGQVIVLSIIDNLVKGAAGQAIQNMNLMLNLDESTSLNMVPLVP